MSDLQLLYLVLPGPTMIVGGLLGFLSAGTENKRFAGTVVMLCGFAVTLGAIAWLLLTA